MMRFFRFGLIRTPSCFSVLRSVVMVAAVVGAVAGSIACQRSSQNQDRSNLEPHPYSPPLALRGYSDLHLPELKCADPAACPSPIGELVTVTTSGTQFCTVTLVKDNVILTASHCVPWENVSPQRGFSGNCWVRWPARGNAPSNVSTCDRVILASEFLWTNDAKVQLDHAFIRLGDTEPRSSQTAQKPFTATFHQHITMAPVSQSVVIYGINPNGVAAHLVVRESCVRNDEFQPPRLKKLAGKTIILPACKIENGFSGGPILDPDEKEIFGVMSLKEKTGEAKELSAAVGTQLPDDALADAGDEAHAGND